MAAKKSVDQGVKTAAVKSGTVIRKCECKNPYQEKLYNGQRVMNIAGKGTKVRCTSCGREQPI